MIHKSKTINIIINRSHSLGWMFVRWKCHFDDFGILSIIFISNLLCLYHHHGLLWYVDHLVNRYCSMSISLDRAQDCYPLFYSFRWSLLMDRHHSEIQRIYRRDRLDLKWFRFLSLLITFSWFSVHSLWFP